MTDKGIVVFDIIGTCFSLDKLQQQLTELGAPVDATKLWFSQSLRDAFALSHAGGYQPLKEILSAELPRTLKLFQIELNSSQRSQVMEKLSQLELNHGAEAAFKLLTEAGYRIVALTNGSERATHKLLEGAGVKRYFSEVYTCDAIAITKPHQDVYRMIKTDRLDRTWLVAAHAWDIMGGIKVGMKTAFVSQLEREYLNIYSQPEIIAENLLEAARQIINLATI
jgi:2-haloacid dehalogenase